jgi:hypothetical protein
MRGDGVVGYGVGRRYCRCADSAGNSFNAIFTGIGGTGSATSGAGARGHGSSTTGCGDDAKSCEA